MTFTQAPAAVLMVRPNCFGYNPQTADSNSFQQPPVNEDTDQIRSEAMREFEGLVRTLKTAGVEVIEFASPKDSETPDAVFPNNWVSFHHEGKVILYPMMAPTRRRERRLDILDTLEQQHGFLVREIIDLSYLEQQDQFLEGTGSMVVDYRNAIVYANHSPRTSAMVLEKAAALLGCEICLFNARDRNGQDIYHTNVMMCIGSTYSVICLDAVGPPRMRKQLEDSLSSNGHEIIEISHSQMEHFAGNMMELQTKTGERMLAMSEKAFNSLTRKQVSTLSQYAELVHAPIDTIEKYGGGSVRCMLAGIFLPRRHGI